MRMPVSSPWAPAAGWRDARMPEISASCLLELPQQLERALGRLVGASGWSSAKPGRRAAHSLSFGLNFIVHEPSG
jgi:hypothetical protein